MADAKPQVVTELPETKRSYFMADPATLLIVGVDFGAEGDRGYDERIKLPLEPALVASIKKRGVLKPVFVRMDGERKVIEDGRRRVLHARAANMELQTDNPGIEATNLIRVPYLVVRGDENAMFALAEVANTYDAKDPPVMQARKIQRALDKGMSEAEICEAFNIQAVTIQDRLRLLDTAPDVLKAIEKGELSANAGLELATVTAPEQLKILAKAREDAIVKGRKEGKLSTKVVTAAVAESRAAGQNNKPTKTTPKDRVLAVERIVHDLMVQVAKSGKPFGADNRTANPPEMAAMFQAIRKIASAVDPDSRRTAYDSTVRELVKALTEDDEDESKESAKPKAAKTDKPTDKAKA